MEKNRDYRFSHLGSWSGAYTYDSEIEGASLRISEAHLSCDSAAKAPLTVTPPPGYTLEPPSKAPDSAPEPGTVPMPPGAVPADSGDSISKLRIRSR